MKPHLPLSILAALSCFFAAPAISATLPAAHLGNVMYVGDSITHGVQSASYRWALHKIFADNGIGLNTVGVNTGNDSGGVAAGTNYGGVAFNNVHSSVASERAYEVAGRKNNSGRLGNTNLEDWLGLDASYTGPYKIDPATQTPDTFFLMIGTNDTLSDYGVNGAASPGIGREGKLTEAQAHLIGTQTGGSWSGSGDLDTIVNTMRRANADASIVLTTIPCWMDNRNNNNTASDFAAIVQYNESLKEWAAWKGVTLVDVNAGMLDVARTDKPGVGLATMFGGDKLHPNAQGDLIIAGNIAKALGYAGRSAGQKRKAAATFTVSTADVYNNSTHAGVSQSGSDLTFGNGASLSYTWGKVPTRGFTMDFAVAVGNGSSGGWNTSGNLSITIGDGSQGGLLQINEAYIQWGQTVLYSTDMSANTDTIRIAYILGNAEQNLKDGYYVWLGDMLIGEALGSNGTATDGLSITNGTGESITLGGLSLDDSASWAPTTTGKVENELLIPTDQQQELAPGTIVWKKDGFDSFVDNVPASGNIRKNKLDSTEGAAGKVVGGIVTTGSPGGTLYVNSGNYTGDIWVTVTGSAKSGTNWNGGHTSQTLDGNLYWRFLDLEESSWKTIFGAVNGTAVTGELYLEISSPGFTSTGNTFNGQNVSIAGSFATDIGKLTTIVLNSGTFNGFIYGGNIKDNKTTHGTKLFINGGTFKSSIYGGGTNGTIDGNVEITVTGNSAIVKNGDTWGTISAVPEQFNAQLPGSTVTGDTIITIKDLEAGNKEDGFDRFAGNLSGGRKEKVQGTRKLLFDHTQLDSFQAVLADFDEVQLQNASRLTLGELGGAEHLIVGEGCELTLTGADYSMRMSHSGVLRLGAGTSLHVTGVGDENLAGVYEVNGGSLSIDEIGCSETVKVTSGRVAISGNLFRGTVRINATGAVDMAGTDGSFISELTTSTATTITGIAGSVSLENASLTVGTDSLTNAVLDIAGSLTVQNDLTLQIDHELLEYLKSLGDGQHDVTLHITTGELSVRGTVQLTQTVGVAIESPTAGLDGTVSFVCGTKNIMNASDTGGTVTGYDGAGIMKDDGTSHFISTVIDRDLAVSLPGAPDTGLYPDGLVINNLEGSADTTLSLLNTGADTALVTLNNHQFQGNTGADTVYLGHLTAAGTDVVKKGEGTLRIEGNITIGTDGKGLLNVAEGQLVLAAVDGLHSAHALSLGADAVLDLRNGSQLSVGSDLALTQGTLTSSDGTGILALDGHDVTLGGDAAVSGMTLILNNASKLTLDTNISLQALSGDSACALAGSGDLALTGTEGVFSGSLAEYRGTITASSGASFTLSGKGSDQTSLRVDNGSLTLSFGDGGAVYQRLDMGPLTTPVTSRSATAPALVIDMTGAMTGGTLHLSQGGVFAQGSVVNVRLPGGYDGTPLFDTDAGSVISFDGTTDLHLLTNGSAADLLINGIVLGAKDRFEHTENLSIHLVGYTGSLIEENGNWVITVQKQAGFTYAAFGQSANAASAGRLLDAASLARPEAKTPLAGVIDAVDALILANRAEEASQTMAAAAGTTVTSLGAAQHGAMRDQMGVIRNRLVNPGLDDTVYNEDMPYFHMWAQATGNHAELDGKKDESGYTLDSWGGTVGFDCDVTACVNAGVAVTASYGDLDAEGAERANGHFDTWFVNLFSTIRAKRWTHKAIATLGITDADLDRTVSLGNTSYRAEGSTEGTSFGLMYELTYDTYLNEDETAILQPLLNLSMINGRIDGYTETGDAGNAALRVGKQTMTTGSIALGARVKGELSVNALGRASFGEFRVNLAQDMGDDRSEADVAFTGAPGATATMRGAKAGTTSVQIGAGLNVPLEEHSSIYFDVNADFRAHASSVNGSIGYRYDF